MTAMHIHIEPPSPLISYSHWRGDSKCYGLRILNLHLIFIAIKEGVQNFTAAIFTPPPPISNSIWGRGSKYCGCITLNYLSISKYFWRGGSNYGCEIMTPPPQSFIAFGKEVQHNPTILFRDVEKSRRVQYIAAIFIVEPPPFLILIGERSK